MRVCIAGGPDIDSTMSIAESVGLSGFEISRVMVCIESSNGCARTVLKWAAKHHVKVQIFPQDRKTYGDQAWVKRNQKISLFSHALIIVWNKPDERSRHLLRCFRQQKKPYYIYYLEDGDSLLQ